jgi:hypothetical protein
MDDQTRTQVLGDTGDPDAPVGSRPWAVAMRLELFQTFQRRDDAENHLQRMRDWFIANQGWSALADANGRAFASWERFCATKPPYGLGTTAKHIDREVEKRRLAPHGGDRKSQDAKKSRLSDNLDFQGTDATYLLARLDRDYPALAARVHAGELKAKTAARQAGIIRDKTPLEQLQAWWRKASPDDRLTFLQWAKTNDVGQVG